MTWRMPAESEPHERTWMAYPSAGYSLGDTADEQHEARSTWAAVAHAVAEFEPVTVVVDPAEVKEARKYLSEKVDIVEAPLNDAWMRDIGPTFVLSDEGRLGGVDWVFNGWGAQ
ncbi:agmatine deiminase family protein, partial [Rhodococcus erythropolis]|nr:agmatine deiminase family protein [Rhodococcus erythropolis]